MTCYVFNTEAAALAAEAKIVSNVRDWVAGNVPNALSEDGTRLRGRNASTGELVDVFTDRWAVPVKTASNKWVFAKPTAEQAAPIPLVIFVAGVTATEAEYDSDWFPPPPNGPGSNG